MKTNEEFARDAIEKNKHVIVTGIYVNSDTEISVKCKYCGLEYNMRPTRILMGRGHQQCLSAIKNKERAKTNDEFLEDLFEINPYVNPLEDYISSGEKIKCECVVCSHIWNVTPNKLLIGRGCPKCRSKKIYQEQFHDGTITNNFQSKESFAKQQEHDKKKSYMQLHII